MFIQKIVVHNIRSYTHQEIEFPKGYVLLSGDIGSGKSSLLLAIEFAIFGILRGALEASALLRHGTEEGFVELTAKIDRHEVTIRRVLKRTKSGITQDAGHIIIDGAREVLTAQELKSKMLALLGYPAELLTKNKSLIFRYTVYTPQEQMKAILFEDADERLNTLRKVFDIDKYKRMQENAQLYVRTLRERRKRLEGEVVDYETKRKQFDLLRNQQKDAEERILKIRPQLKVVQQEVNAALNEVKKVETKMQELLEAKKQLQIAETTIKYELQRKQESEEAIKRGEAQLSILKEEFAGVTLPDHQTIIQSMKETEKRLTQIQRERELAGRQISELAGRIAHAKEIKQKLSVLDACPVCLQNVTKEHKETVAKSEDTKSREHVGTQMILQQKLTEWEKERKTLEEDLTHLRTKEREAAVLTIKQTALREKEQSLETLKVRIPEINKRVEKLQEDKKRWHEECFSKENAQTEYTKARTACEALQKQERDLAIKAATVEKELQTLDQRVQQMQQEIASKEIAKKRLEKLTAMSHWIAEFFVPLMSVMEKHVLGKVYHQFNGLFEQWFKMLLEDESLQARLNESFAPVIIQNGYETEIQNLSGGEKTSCALAYRLALNKVINACITTMHTRELIILDEPTEGFSTEQLDRVREVIDELNLEQVIIVSHEAKIEGFVDSTIRITKQDQESVVNA